MANLLRDSKAIPPGTLPNLVTLAGSDTLGPFNLLMQATSAAIIKSGTTPDNTVANGQILWNIVTATGSATGTNTITPYPSFEDYATVGATLAFTQVYNNGGDKVVDVVDGGAGAFTCLARTNAGVETAAVFYWILFIGRRRGNAYSPVSAESARQLANIALMGGAN